MEFPSLLDIDFVRKLDSEDKLADFRKLFYFSDPEICYLDGNSLGRLPRRTIDEVKNDIVLVQTQPIYEYNLFTSLLLGVFNNPVFAQASAQ